jgi:cell wall-associated NlpC family hydrolase
MKNISQWIADILNNLFPKPQPELVPIPVTPPPAPTSKKDDWVKYLKQFLGLPYIWGGSNIKVGLDCSGFAQVALAWLHLDPPGDQTADALMRYFLNPKYGTKIERGDIRCGDLIYYGRTHATHIVIALSNDEMIEAGGGGSKTTTVEIARKQGACIRISKIDRRRDFICATRPKGLPW